MKEEKMGNSSNNNIYDGLLSRLQDDVSRGDGKPKDLLDMHRKAQNSDAHYWECIQERSREGNTNSKTTLAKTPKIGRAHV